MPRSGPNGTYTLPGAQDEAQPNTTIQSSINNQGWADIEQTFNTPQPIAYGGTGAATAAAAAAALEVVSYAPQVLSGPQQAQARANIGADLLRGDGNAIDNGNFDIWQRGTAHSAGSVDVRYLADRWFTNGFGATQMAASRQSFAPGQTDVAGNPKYFHRVVVTNFTGDAGDGGEIGQPIEGVGTFAGERVTLTLYAKASLSAKVGLIARQIFGTGGSPSASVDTIIGVAQLTTGWQKITITFDLPSIAGKTLGTNGNDCLHLLLFTCAGSTYQPLFPEPIYAGNGTFDLARVSLVGGDATKERDPFPARSIAVEEARCRRFYQQLYGNSLAWGFVTGAAVVELYFKPTDMRIPTPTMSLVGNDFRLEQPGANINDLNGSNVSSYSIVGGGVKIIMNGIVGLSGTNGSVVGLYGFGASNYIALDAELY